MALEPHLPTHILQRHSFVSSPWARLLNTHLKVRKMSPRLDLKLHLSVPVRRNTEIRMRDEDGDEEMDVSSDSSSSPSSCVSSESASSPEATSMVLAGCPRCLMYVMLPEEDPRCPKCKSAVLLDFFNNYSNNKNKVSDTNNNKNKKC